MQRIQLLVGLVLISASLAQFTVSVTEKSPSNPWYGVGSTASFAIDGDESKTLSLIKGLTYTFTGVNVPSSHRFYISASPNGIGAQPVVDDVYGHQMTGNDVLQVTVPENVTTTYLYYQSWDDWRMGGRIELRDNEPPPPPTPECFAESLQSIEEDSAGHFHSEAYCSVYCSSLIKCFQCCQLFPIGGRQAECRATCHSSNNASALADPDLTGYRGQSYHFEGTPGHVYAMVSDTHFLANARFTAALTDGTSATSAKDKNVNTYMTEIGFRIHTDAEKDSLVDIKCHEYKDLVVSVDGKELAEASSSSGDYYIVHHLHHRHGLLRQVSVRVHGYSFVVWASAAADSLCFLNMQSEYVREKPDDPYPEGVLGESAHPVPGAQMVSESRQGRGILKGKLSDYQIEGSGIFESKFEYSVFNAEDTGKGVPVVSEAQVKRRSSRSVLEDGGSGDDGEEDVVPKCGMEEFVRLRAVITSAVDFTADL